MTSMPDPLPPSLWSDTARGIAVAIGLFAVAGVGFGLGYLLYGQAEQTNGGATTTSTVNASESPMPAEGSAYPELATRNTTRAWGTDSASVAASVARATYPTAGGYGAAAATTIVPAESWQLSLAATPLTADPIGAPILLGSDEVFESTASALDALKPTGLESAGGTQAFVVGDLAVPEGLKTTVIEGADPADVANQIDLERAKITGVEDPAHLLVVSSENAGLSLPASAWAARSGDPILFADGDDVPAGTMKVIKRHPDTPVFVLGPESVVSNKALEKLGNATRIGSEGVVENSIEFARFTSGDFGWNINDPGHGFAIANVARPLDPPAAAALASTGGSPGPLLLTDDAKTIPPALQSFLSDTQPGFQDDPTRAVFNHVWIIGDAAAISVPFQAQVDQLTELAPVSTATTPPEPTVPPATEGTTTLPDLGDLGGGATTPGATTTTPEDSAPTTTTGSDGQGG
jgi:hypothetical protein